MSRLYPVVDYRALRAAGYANVNAALSHSERAAFIRQGAMASVDIVEYAFKVIALGVMVLLVARLAATGTDTFSAAMERLRKIPAVAGTLLKFYAIALAIGLGTGLVATLPVLILIPMRIQWHMSPGSPRWIPMLSADLGTLFFVLCVMPFLLDLVWRLQRRSADEGAPQGLLGRALGYGTAAVAAEIALDWVMRSMRMALTATPPVGDLIGHGAISLAVSLITSLPTIVCVVVIAVMVMDAAETVTEAEAA
jgi:hypothetical protein